MPRIRTIKPEFTQDEELSALPAEVHLLAAGLLCYSDDYGYFNANPQLVKAVVFPLRETSMNVQGMLTELSNIGFIRLGKAQDGKKYGHVVKFLEHQRVNRPTPSKIQELRIIWDTSVRTHTQLTESSVGKGKEGKGRERNLEGEDHNNVNSATNDNQSQSAPPDELPIHALAAGMIENLQIPSTANLLDLVAQAIGIVAAQEKCSKIKATEFLHHAAQLAMKDNVRVNRFWFEDQKYSDYLGTPNRKNGPCEKHPKSGLTQWGSCWDCYEETHGARAEVTA